MRYRKPFTVFPRKLKSGKKIYYYHAYDADGRRTNYRSTGQSTRAAAETYCFKLYRENKLLTRVKEITFAEYTRHWWIFDKCVYIRGRKYRGFPITRRYANNQRMNLEKHILPVFGDMKLNRITVTMIDSWLLSFLEKGYSGSMANQCLSALRPVFSEAQREGLITSNPAEKIKPLKIVNEKKSILTKDEFLRLFDPDKMAVYWIRAEYYVASLLAACTGMRLGEVQALQGPDLIPGHVRACHSWDRKYGLKDTKTHDSREIPVFPGLHKMLDELKRENSGGFLFSGDGGQTPFYYTSITDALYKALDGIGITEEQRKERNITFHSWRHYFNSRSRGKIADHLLQRLTGHKTQAMTENYTHVAREDYKELVSIQESFFVSDTTDQGAAYVN